MPVMKIAQASIVLWVLCAFDGALGARPSAQHHDAVTETLASTRIASDSAERISASVLASIGDAADSQDLPGSWARGERVLRTALALGALLSIGAIAAYFYVEKLVADQLPESSEAQEEEASTKCAIARGCCCFWSFLPASLLLLYLAVLALGAMGSKPPRLPTPILTALTDRYTTLLPEKFPARARMSEAPSTSAADKPDEATAYYTCMEDDVNLADAALPDEEEVFEKLLARKEFVADPTGLNLLLVTFVNFFLEDFFRTIPNTNGSYVNRGVGLLSQVYGTSEERMRILREGQGGRMKLGDDGRLPRWVDLAGLHPQLGLRCSNVPGEEQNLACLEESENWYACGDERCNTHPGFLFWSHLFVRHHNYLADFLAASYPTMTDDELFEAAQKVNQWSMFKMAWGEYVFKMTCGKDLCTSMLDVALAKELSSGGFDREEGYNISMSFEFNQLYQWHHWIPDYILWDDVGEDKTAFTEHMWNPDAFKSADLQSWGEAFQRTPMGRIQPQNYPRFMKRSFVKFLKYSRANNIASYNTYREFFKLGKYTSFDQFGASQEVTEELKRLYGGDIDRVEFQVGLFTDNADDPLYVTLGLHHPLPESLKRFVATFAFTYIVNTPIVQDPTFLTAASLTEKGLEYGETLTWETMLENSGVRGLGKRPNEVPGSWRPPALTTATVHGVLAIARLLR